MKITIKKRSQPFTQVDNILVNDTRLSMQAIGLFVYLWSKPDDWEYIKEQLAKRFNIGRDALNSALKLLENCNYIYKQFIRDENGKFTNAKWILSDIGNAKELLDEPLTEKQNTEKPYAESPYTENPLADNPQLVIYNKQRLFISNKDNNNSDLKEIIKQDKIKTELDLFCDEVVIGLKEILSKKLNRNIATNNWSKEIKLIVNNDLKIRGEQQAKQDLTRCIKAIESNYGKDYFPIIQSAKSLREKFIKIEDYLARSNKKSNEPVNFINEANNIAGMKVFLQMEVLSNKVEIVSNGKALDIPPEKRALIKAMFEEMFGKKEMVVR
jgi:hypothetical protein